MTTSTPVPLSPELLLKRCSEDEIGGDPPETAESPEELAFIGLGQNRFFEALKLGISTEDPYHNISVVGLSGPAGFATVGEFLKEALAKENIKRPAPCDWCYVYDALSPRMPLPVPITKGGGQTFRRKMHRLLQKLVELVPEAVRSDAVLQGKARVRERHLAWIEKQQRAIVEEGNRLGWIAEGDFTSGAINIALRAEKSERKQKAADEQPEAMLEEDYGRLPEEERLRHAQNRESFMVLIQKYTRELGKRSLDVREAYETLEREAARDVIERIFEKTRLSEVKDDETVARYLKGLKEHSLEHYEIFGGKDDEGTNNNPFGALPVGDKFLPWKVNVFVDNSETVSSPVVAEPLSSIADLVGGIERTVVMGAYYTDHTRMFAGALARANGGYLIVDVKDLFSVAGLWLLLKRCVRQQEVTIETPYSLAGLDAPPLQPVSIPLNVRVILFGSRWMLEYLEAVDGNEVSDLFKIRADIAPFVARTAAQTQAYARWAVHLTEHETLPPLSRDALGALMEHASRLAEHQGRFSTDFERLETVIRQAAIFALKEKKESSAAITETHIRRTLREQFWRSGFVYEYIQNAIRDGTILVETRGAEVGQVNGLYVLSRHGALFGFPTRITASVNMGRPGIINIHRASNLGGDIFDKADRTVQAVLKNRFAQDTPLSLEAHLSFEQTYGMVDGDSASLAEFFAILSSIADMPIQQCVAITGSMDLRGSVQPVGGVNEKIEGFFDCLKAQKALTAGCGVVIPRQNAAHLMLRDDIVESAARGEFAVWAIGTLDDGVRILTGVHPQEVYTAARDRLRTFSKNAEDVYRRLHDKDTI